MLAVLQMQNSSLKDDGEEQVYVHVYVKYLCVDICLYVYVSVC